MSPNVSTCVLVGSPSGDNHFSLSSIRQRVSTSVKCSGSLSNDQPDKEPPIFFVACGNMFCHCGWSLGSASSSHTLVLEVPVFVSCNAPHHSHCNFDSRTFTRFPAMWTFVISRQLHDLSCRETENLQQLPHHTLATYPCVFCVRELEVCEIIMDTPQIQRTVHYILEPELMGTNTVMDSGGLGLIRLHIPARLNPGPSPVIPSRQKTPIFAAASALDAAPVTSPRTLESLAASTRAGLFGQKALPLTSIWKPGSGVRTYCSWISPDVSNKPKQKSIGEWFNLMIISSWL